MLDRDRLARMIANGLHPVPSWSRALWPHSEPLEIFLQVERWLAAQPKTLAPPPRSLRPEAPPMPQRRRRPVRPAQVGKVAAKAAERYKAAWLMRFVEGLTLKQIAKRIGAGTAERARQILASYERRLRWRTRNPDPHAGSFSRWEYVWTPERQHQIEGAWPKAPPQDYGWTPEIQYLLEGEWPKCPRT